MHARSGSVQQATKSDSCLLPSYAPAAPRCIVSGSVPLIAEPATFAYSPPQSSASTLQLLACVPARQHDCMPAGSCRVALRLPAAALRATAVPLLAGWDLTSLARGYFSTAITGSGALPGPADDDADILPPPPPLSCTPGVGNARPPASDPTVCAHRLHASTSTQ